ncbi:S1C family serine protease [Scleromatobacter humisilvae]|uniref:Trypsin-like peptidase domain-containing protein n=1 Tax=Scleromatobacter humisilvae TaxID=2897159 RepID=A0A9X2C1M4_9BURK|nr:trypsin-like peptidase domain-containing protein [Scleromatobacter humisilvae]MCK9685145.1 trypsin-like peptidase domain-containing protein [Scleromatobacter humisilvae]
MTRRPADLPSTFARSFASTLLLSGALIAAHATDIDLKKPQPQGLTRTPTKIELPPGGRVMEFSKWKTVIPPNDVVGEVKPGVFCSEGRELQYNKKIDEWLHFSVDKAFKAEVVRYGFSTPEEAISVFDDKGNNGTDYRIGATLMAFDYRTCGDKDQSGSAYSKVKWEVFSVRRQQVVYSAVIENSFASSKDIPEKEFDAAVMAGLVDNLLADPAFVAVIKSGGMAETAPAQAQAALRLDPGQVVAGGVDKGTPKILAAVATVESGIGSGSAFYISQQGYLLTNKHVVGDDKFVRVKLSTGRSLVGEVIRVDKVRDVALLHTDPVGGEALALRPDGGVVGEVVYAVGSPFGQSLSGTLTRGVLSARRVFEGVPYLQSDVAVNPGNSGGPLIDANGRVIGMSAMRLDAQGINIFIPIDDVLDKLSLTLGSSVAAAPATTATAK